MNDSEIRSKMDKAIAVLEENLRKLRTGRANTSLLESVKVEAYGTYMPLNQVATVNLQDFKTLLIQPWDKANIEPILKGIASANLGMNPVQGDDVIRVIVPDLTEERRKDLTKLVGNYEEETKIALRGVRKEAIEEMKNDKEATEDDVRSVTEQVDKIIKEYNIKVQEISDRKRAEMMEV